MSALAVLWFFLIFVLIAGYFVLDGFDLGVGVLYRALAKTDAERALVRRSIGPVWRTPRRFRGFTWRSCSCFLA